MDTDAIAQALLAAAATRAGDVHRARAHLEAARRHTRTTARRERQVVEIVALVVAGDEQRAGGLAVVHLAEFPDDAHVLGVVVRPGQALDGGDPGRASVVHQAAPPNATPWPDDHVPTPFQRAVAEAVAALRPGELVSYGEVAEEIGRPGAGQAVANVLRCAPDLPWWRVVPTDGRLYRTHAPVQAPLLEAEGHRIDGERRIHPRAAARPD